MLAFVRAVGAFFLMMAIGYLAMVVMLPAPTPGLGHPDELMTGRSAAVRLSDEARALSAHKPVGIVQ